MTVGQQIASRDFMKVTLRALSRMGVELVSVQAIPGDGLMPWANASRGYVVNDNGTSKVWTFADVMQKARS